MELDSLENAFISLPPSISANNAIEEESESEKEKLVDNIFSSLSKVYYTTVNMKLEAMKEEIDRVFFLPEQLEPLAILIISMEMSTAEDWMELETFLKAEVSRKRLKELPSDYPSICKFISSIQFSKEKSDLLFIPRRPLNLSRENMEDLSAIFAEILAANSVKVKLILPLINPPPKDLFLGCGLDLVVLTFIDSRSLCHKFLCNVAKSRSCLPIISRTMIVKLASEVEIYMISLSELFNRIKKLLLSYIWNLRKGEIDLLNSYYSLAREGFKSSGVAKDSRLNILLNFKNSVFSSIQVFEDIFTVLADNDPNKNFHFVYRILTNETIPFTLPDKTRFEVTSEFAAKNTITAVIKKIKDFKEPMATFTVQQLEELLSEDSKAKPEVSNKRKSASDNLNIANSSASGGKIYKMEKILRHFAKKGILERIYTAADELPELFMENVDQYHSLIKPDVVGNLFIHLYSLGPLFNDPNSQFGFCPQEDPARVEATKSILKLVLERGIYVSGVKLYEDFKETRGNEKEYITDLYFLNAINELRYLGFLGDKNSEKFTVLKTIFGKSRVVQREKNN